MVNKLWILLSALLMVAMPSAQAGELNLYSMNTGSYVYHMTGNHGQYNEHFNNNFSRWSASFLRIQNTACWSER